MKKISLSVMAILIAATSLMANTPVNAKKAKAKQATCTTCPKGAKCTKAECPRGSGCCK